MDDYRHERNGHHAESDGHLHSPHQANGHSGPLNHHVNGDHNNNSNYNPQRHHNGNINYHQQEMDNDSGHDSHPGTPPVLTNERKTFSGQSTFPLIGSRRGSSNSGLTDLLDADDSDEGNNVNVVVRLRPYKDGEEADIRFPGNGQILIDKGENKRDNKPRHFTFNVAFEGNATQQDVFDHSGIKNLIDMAIEGYSCTVFCYGQTGSGKTHTLSGPHHTSTKGHRAVHHQPHLDGLMQKSFTYLFRQLASKPNKKNTVIKASYLEIYNEQVIDLLNPAKKKYLTVRWAKDKGFYVENLFLVECVEDDDVLAVMEEGLRNRQVSANNVNENSSRSHAILTIYVTTEEKDPEDEKTFFCKHGKIIFTDLAGSEKVTEKSASQGSMNETNKINRSLLTLGKCISSLGDMKKKKAHIPYRDSQLTKLLKDSIGGNGVTLMIACISSLKANISESLNTLYYATQTKKIKNKPHIMLDPREYLILCLKRELKVCKAENQYLKEQLQFPKITRSASAPQPAKNLVILEKLKTAVNTGQLPNGQLLKDILELVKDYTVENEALRDENSDLLRNKDVSMRDYEHVSRENERLIKKVESFERNPSLSPGHSSSLSTGSRSTLSDFEVGGHGSSPNLVTRPPPHLAHPVKPPYRLPTVPDSISKELKKRRIGENVNDAAKPWNTARARPRRNSWDNSGNDGSKKSQTAGSKNKKPGALFGDDSSNLVRRSESDQHLRKNVEKANHNLHSTGKERLTTSTSSLPKLLGYESPHPTKQGKK